MWWFSGCDRIWYLQARVATVVEDTVKVRLAQAHLAQADSVVKVAMAVAQPRVYRMLINCAPAGGGYGGQQGFQQGGYGGGGYGASQGGYGGQSGGYGGQGGY